MNRLLSRVHALPQAFRDYGLLVLLSALVFLPGLGKRDLWSPDEPRYAEVTREMIVSGNFLVPHLNGEIYSEKPPLQFWAMALAATLRGRLDEVAVRLPTAVSAIATILLVFWLGSQFFNRRVAWMAALAFGSCRKILWQGRDGQIDMLLVLLVTVAVCFWVRGFQEERPGFYRLFFLAAGLATVAKGPVGLLPPLLSILAFLLVTRRGAQIRSLGIGVGLVIWAATVLAWLVPAAFVAGREYLEIMVFKQNLTRYADPWHHYRPWYYYLGVMLTDFFPWSFFLPAAVVTGWRRVRGPEREGFLFALCWAAVTLVFFSISSAKRTVYILSMYPALALLVGLGLERMAVRWPEGRRWFHGTMAPIFLLLAAIAVAVPHVAGGRPELEALEASFPVAVAVVVAGVALAAGVSWWWGGRGRIDTCQRILAAAMAGLGLTFFVYLAPRVDALKSARPLAEILLAQIGPDEPYGIYPRLDAPFLFYTERFAVELHSEAELRAFAQRPGRVWVLAERDDLEKIAEPLPLVEVARDQDLTKGYLLLRTPEPGEATSAAGAAASAEPAPDR